MRRVNSSRQYAFSIKWLIRRVEVKKLVLMAADQNKCALVDLTAK